MTTSPDRSVLSSAVATRCFACDGTRLESFYEVRDVPVHSVVLVDDAETARNFPTGDIRLQWCRGCGFIQNGLFDPVSVDYTQEFEETQGFSPTFRSFAEDLVEELDRRYRLEGKQVLEVGCGSAAEFLVLLCRRTGASGIGIDPCHRAERRPEDAPVEVVAEHYTDEHDHLTGDLVVSRHTLEHIQPVRSFVERLRRSTARTRGGALFLEVPDTTRVLRETAFWDVYHEHCSYFTAGSLSRLVATSGFVVDEVRLGFEGQYLLLHAHPGEDDTPGSAGERDVAAFADRVGPAIERWEDRLEAQQGRRVVLWGGGSKAVAFLTTIRNPERVAEVVDINPHKQGRVLPVTAHPVVAPADAAARGPDLVIVMNPVYEQEIRDHLDALHVQPEVTGLT